jgi:hypothetical protein
MPRFAILEHDHPELHWDLLLEAGAALRTWRLAQPPEHPHPIAATQLPDHRTLYLDYEGPVSGGRGVVRAWDRGVFTPELPAADTGPITLRLCGARVNADALLQRQEGVVWEFRLLAAAAGVNVPPAPGPDAPS